MEFFLVLGPQMSCPGGPVQYKVLVPNKQPPAWFTWGLNFVNLFLLRLEGFHKFVKKIVCSVKKNLIFFKIFWKISSFGKKWFLDWTVFFMVCKQGRFLHFPKHPLFVFFLNNKMFRKNVVLFTKTMPVSSFAKSVHLSSYWINLSLWTLCLYFKVIITY